jgi:hypothetical protein
VAKLGIGAGRRARGVAAVALSAVLTTAGLIAGEAAPAGAVVGDQPLSANASSMWQTNNTVWALDADDGVVYAGGDFTSVRPPGSPLGQGEVARNRLAAFSASSGNLVTSFNPNVNGRVYDVEVSPDGNKLYIVGSFTTVGGQTRQRIARLNLPSGDVDTAWTANANAIVSTVTVNGSGVWVGGDFTSVKGVARTRLARLSTTNGNVSTQFDASSDKRITESAIAPNGTRLLVGGENDVVNGQPQEAIASLDPTTGELEEWQATGVAPRLANGGCDANLTDIVISGSTAYVTAEAPRPGCWEGVYAANVSDGELLWNMKCLGGSTSLAIAQGWLYRGSHMHDCAKNVNGFTGPNDPDAFIWYRLQVHSLGDGRLGHWTPNTNGGSPGTSTTVGPQVMATDGNQVFIGGDQSQVNGQGQQGIARFATSGGNSAPQTPPAPTATAAGEGRVVVNATGVADNNDGVLTYRLYRNGGNTPIATATAESWPWTRPTVRFVDSNLNDGSSVTYQVQAFDGSASGNRSAASAPVTVVGGTLPSYASRVKAASPVSYWPLHTMGPLMADASKQGRTGRIEGGVTRKESGVIPGNHGILTDGSSGYVRSNAPWTPGTSFSQAVWFRTTSETGGTLMGSSDAPTGPGTANHRAMWMDNDGKVAFGMLVAEADDPEDVEAQFVRSPARYNDGRWHHAVATFNGRTIALYVDGTRVVRYDRLPDDDPVVATGAGYTRVGYLDLTNFYTVFGRNYDGAPSPTSYFFQGGLDEASVHSRALSMRQVAEMWQSGAAVLNA